MKQNETIFEIRKTRKEISRKFDFDPKRLVAFYKEKQQARIKNRELLKQRESETVE